MINAFEKYPIASLAIAVILMLLIHLNIPDVTIMEARNFITAREMVQDQHWLLTTMNGEPRYEKPPLPTWLAAISGSIFGIHNLFALRLPGALMVLLLGISIYFISLQLKLSKQHSFRNSLILITSFYIIAIVIEAPWDIFAHGFMILGLYFLLKFFTLKNADWKNAIIAAVFLGFSIMSKGPVSLYAVFLPFLVAFSIVYKFKDFKKKVLPFLIFIFLMLLVGAWWYIYVRIQDPVIFTKIASKESSNWSSYNVRPFYYYWNFFIQSGIWTIPAFVSLLFPYLKNKVKNKKAYLFTLWWTLISVILLSIIPEKKPRYLVPVLIPLAMNTGFYIQYLIESFSKLKQKKETLPVYFNFGLIGLIAIALPFLLFYLLNFKISHVLFSYILITAASLLIGIFIFVNLRKRNIKMVFYLTVSLIISIAAFGLPISKYLMVNKNYNSLKNLHKIEAKNHIKTYSIKEITPELLWQYNGILQNIYTNQTVNIPSENKFGILIMEEDESTILRILEEGFNVTFVANFDINPSNKRKERLIRNLYILSKKE